jgi:3-mercaptopyruvate sulfurtransferase SseA
VQILNQKGIKNAAALLGGTAAWEKAGYPMEVNENASSQDKNSNGGQTKNSNGAQNKEAHKHDESKPHDH